MPAQKRISNKIKVKCVRKHIFESVSCKKLGEKSFNNKITKTKSYK